MRFTALVSRNFCDSIEAKNFRALLQLLGNLGHLDTSLNDYNLKVVAFDSKKPYNSIETENFQEIVQLLRNLDHLYIYFKIKTVASDKLRFGQLL